METRGGLFFFLQDIFLFLFSCGAFLYKDGFFGMKGIPFGIVHHGGVGKRGRGEDLDLFRGEMKMFLDEVFGSLHILKGTSRMSGYEIVGEKLFLARLF